MTILTWLRNTFKEKAPTRPVYNPDGCLNPDYCGTGDADTLFDNCIKLMK